MPERTLSDPVIDEIRAVRSRISAQFDHDPKKLVQYYMELQKRHADRLVGGVKDPRRRMRLRHDRIGTYEIMCPRVSSISWLSHSRYGVPPVPRGSRTWAAM